ncbi:unnamed protein product [Paramecium sonneborni]|uniref:Uncharacterized protein n=1 Tax=Paramecium sonneborni TaxID=65129 RepID=A0A8S1RV25_9CILI|nr:unnamed protein product [Paramecium sonneborni]
MWFKKIGRNIIHQERLFIQNVKKHNNIFHNQKELQSKSEFENLKGQRATIRLPQNTQLNH